MDGTANIAVTRYSTRSRTQLSGSNRRGRTAVAPTWRVGRVYRPMPPEWNRGRTFSVTSRNVSPMAVVMFTLFQNCAAWRNTTPLGRPVVPEVYRMRNGSSKRPAGGPAGSRRRSRYRVA
jgi:hypothetical protein